ncbi:hypothetical protein [Candidatus Pantoea formicae]|uniref:hypothetical protein n=1 Tax=Candidatus Pantoea formicae TaxID=2608355 RepID=UPI003EDAB1B0
MSKALSEELKDLKIQQILEDYIALQKEIGEIPEKLKAALEKTDSSIEKLPEYLSSHTSNLSEAFREVIDSSGEQLTERFHSIVEACQDVEKEINDTVDSGKNEFSKHMIGLTSTVKSDFKDMTDNYQSHINSLIKQNKPFSFGKAISICVLSVVVISTVVCGSVIYASNEHFTSRLNFYGSAYHDLHQAAENAAKSLPKGERELLLQKMKSIDDRSM